MGGNRVRIFGYRERGYRGERVIRVSKGGILLFSCAYIRVCVCVYVCSVCILYFLILGFGNVCG